ncbi:MAG: amidohydrolase family protein [Gemmatimonadaceae bacterium]
MCNYTSILALSLLAACTAPRLSLRAADEPAQHEQVVAITHANVITPGADTAASDMTIIVRGRSIRTVGKTTDVALPADAAVVDAHGMYVIPGLWDMHTHLVLEGGSYALAQYVSRGVTGVRDMGSQFETVDSMRHAAARGAFTAPRVLAAGPMIENAAAMVGILKGASHDDSLRALHDRLPLPSPSEATRSVDSLARLGVDMIKGRDFADAPTYWAIAAAARRNGLSFVGHAPFGLAVDAAALADSGQRSIEHWFFPLDLFTVPAAEYARVVRAYAAHGTALTPTLGAWRQHRFVVDSLRAFIAVALRDPRAATAPLLVAHWKKDVADRQIEIDGKPATVAQLVGWNRVLDEFARQSARLAGDGMPLLAGSDLPFARYPGDALHDELVFLVREGGLTPSRALVAATTAPARLLRMQDSLGTIQPNMIADLVLLESNPLANIENVRGVIAVMQGGSWTWHRPR